MVMAQFAHVIPVMGSVMCSLSGMWHHNKNMAQGARHRAQGKIEEPFAAQYYKKGITQRPDN
jgi:hypothetical protein